MKSKFLIPGAYTAFVRLASLKAVLTYSYTNLVVPIALMACIQIDSFDFTRLTGLMLSWLLIHMVYELGYFMNDFFAVDAKGNWRDIPNLARNDVMGIFAVKVLLVVSYVYCLNDLVWGSVAGVLFLVYLFHNYLQKPYRLFTFVLLRILKFSPFIYFQYEVSSILFLYFLVFGILEGLRSYFPNKTNSNLYRNLYYFPALLLLPEIMAVLVSVMLTWFPRVLRR